MNKLNYSLALIKSLTADIRSEENKNHEQFLAKIFNLYLKQRTPGSILTRPNQADTIKSSFELLLQYTDSSDVDTLANSFRRETRPEHLPAYGFLFDSINPNLFTEERQRSFFRLVQPLLEERNYSKLQILLRLLIGRGNPVCPGLKDYQQLRNAIRRIAREADQETNRQLLQMLHFRKLRERVHPHQQVETTAFYEALQPAMQELLQRFPDLGNEPFMRTLIPAEA